MGSSVWLIAGPTASGKSALALRLAEALGGEIVNADSMQLYADLRLVTARPSAADEARAPHHLYGVADAADAWSVGRWLQAVKAVLSDIAGRERTAVVTGGTGLYFRALTSGLADIPAVPQAVREDAARLYDLRGEAAFRAALAAPDAVSAARIESGDRQRLLRAWGVVQATGVALPDWQAATQPTLQADSYAAVVLEPPRAALYARCDARMASMAADGAVEEVARLMARSLSADLPAVKALGVREFAAFVRRETSLTDAVAAAQRRTRNYAKRQSTWFRNQTPDWPRITDPEPDARWAALAILAGLARA